MTVINHAVKLQLVERQGKATWGWNRIASKGHFQQREPERPEVGCHAVLGALQPLWGHIGPGSHKAVRHRVDQLPRNAKVTDFNLPGRVHEYVAWLDIPENVEDCASGKLCLADL